MKDGHEIDIAIVSTGSEELCLVQRMMAARFAREVWDWIKDVGDRPTHPDAAYLKRQCTHASTNKTVDLPYAS